MRQEIVNLILKNERSKGQPVSLINAAWLEIELRDLSDAELTKCLLERVNLLDIPIKLIRAMGVKEDYMALREENTRLNRNVRPEQRVKPKFSLKEKHESKCCDKPTPFTYFPGSKPETVCASCSRILKTRDVSPSKKARSVPSTSAPSFTRWKDFSLSLLKYQGRSMLKATHTELGIIRGELAEFSYDSIRIFLRKKKWNHLYQNIYSVMEALTPGCRPTFTDEILAEIKRVFEEMGFEGTDQKGVHKSD